jgi:hypothetical protein
MPRREHARKSNVTAAQQNPTIKFLLPLRYCWSPGLAKSNSHLYAVPGLRTCSSLLESTEPTGALVITDTLPSTSVAQRDFPLTMNFYCHYGLLNLRVERIGEALGGTATRRKYRARGYIIRKEGYRRWEFLVLRFRVFVGVPV